MSLDLFSWPSKISIRLNFAGVTKNTKKIQDGLALTCGRLWVKIAAVKQAILAHYHEINLKGNNRGWFEAHLEKNALSILKGLPHDGVRRFAGRLRIGLLPDSPVDEIARRLQMVFGIANLVIAREVEAGMDAIQAALSEMVSAADFKSFKIDARRGSKNFPLDSMEINRQLGAFVQQLTGAAVRMEHPDATFFVEIAGGRAFLYTAKIRGAGGLPSGTGGKVLCLLSGGIDSPVAAFRLMRRGCRVLHVHFHSFPHTTTEAQEKVRRILGILSRYQEESILYLIPFAEVQHEIVAYAPAPLRVILYRRFMMRIAQAVAQKGKRFGAGNRRQPRAGRQPDAGKPAHRLRRDHSPHLPAADRRRQGRDHAARAGDRDL